MVRRPLLVVLCLLLLGLPSRAKDKVKTVPEGNNDVSDGMFFVGDPGPDIFVGSGDHPDPEASGKGADDEDDDQDGLEGSGAAPSPAKMPDVDEDDKTDSGSGFDFDSKVPESVSSPVPNVPVTEKPRKSEATKKPVATGSEKEKPVPEKKVPEIKRTEEETNRIPETFITVESTTKYSVPLSSSTPKKGKPNNNDDGNNLTNEVSILGQKQEDRPTSFFAQPGILAAVIGGAVVGLLCAILLVMFIVYRMRKKDEGSYTLDEPKRSPSANPYSRGGSKEFYA